MFRVPRKAKCEDCGRACGHPTRVMARVRGEYCARCKDGIDRRRAAVLKEKLRALRENRGGQERLGGKFRERSHELSRGGDGAEGSYSPLLYRLVSDRSGRRLG